MFLGGGEDFRQVDSANTGALASQSTTDIHQAGGVTAGDVLGLGFADVAGLITDHRCGDLRVLEGEGAAETAAFFCIRQRGEVDSLDLLQQLVGAVTQLEATRNSGRSRVLPAAFLAPSTSAEVPKRSAIISCCSRTAPTQEPEAETT